VDITEHKREELVSAKLAAIVQSSEDAIIGKDLNGVITSWNRGAEKLFGYTSAEMLGTTMQRLIPADRRQEEQDILEKIRSGSRVERFETLRQTKDGRLLDVSITASPIKDADGTVVGVSKAARDITESKKEKAKLMESEERFRCYFELPLIGSCITSVEKGWIDANDRLSEILGYSREDLFGKTWAEMTHPEDLAGDVTQFDRILAGEIDQYRLEKRFIRKDGATIYADISVGCVRHPNGKVELLICMVDDITDRKLAEQELRQQTEELTRFNRLMSCRELRVVELKQQVNELAAKLGQPHPYPLAFLDAAAAEVLRSTPKLGDHQPEISGQKSAITETQKE